MSADSRMMPNESAMRAYRRMEHIADAGWEIGDWTEEQYSQQIEYIHQCIRARTTARIDMQEHGYLTNRGEGK